MSNPSPDLSLSLDAAEERVRGFLAEGKWRRARDEAKPLVKAERGRFLPLLIQANAGLARKMLADGNLSDVRQVLSHLATIAPADQLLSLELELAAKAGGPGSSLPKVLAALAESNAAIPESERIRLADLAVLAFEPVPAGDSAQTRIAAELCAVQGALRAVSQAEWQKASEALRAVPHRSVFSPWAVLIKAIVAFHSGETDKAARLLHGLPPGSVPAKAGAAYLALLDPSPAAGEDKAMPEAILEGVCRLTGAGAKAALLLRADTLWREGRHAESYRILRDGAEPFPSQALDWRGALSEFYFKAPHSMSRTEEGAYLRFFDGLLSRDRTKNDCEAMLTHQMFALVERAIAPAGALSDDWESFLRQYEAVHGHNPRLASLAYGWLGEQLSLARAGFASGRGRQRLRDPSGAVEVLRKAIELDPANLAAHLQLCAVYDALKKTGERNRLLDAMTARFPDDKQVLLLAAQRALDRKAFHKGLDYLARAGEIDRIDPRVPQLTVAALWRLARQQFQQRQPDKARQTMARVEALATADADDFHRARWAALVRQAALERLWGDAAASAELLGKARAGSPDETACLFFAHLTHRVYSSAGGCESPFLEELKQALGRAPSVGGVGRLLRMIDYWKSGPEGLETHGEDRMLRASLQAALDQPFTRAEAAGVVERTGGNAAYSKPVKALVKKVLRGDPLDPGFRLLQLAFPHGRGFGPSRGRLQSILDEAVRRHDEAAMRRARQMLHDLECPPPPAPDAFEPDFDADAFEPDAGPGPDLPPEEILGQFGEMLDLLRVAPEFMIREIRRKFREIPDAVFNELVRMAKSGGRPPAPAPRLPPRSHNPPAPSSPADLGQMNLF